MNLVMLQTRLRTLGYNPGLIDGKWGNKTRGAVLEAMTDGPDTPLSETDYAKVAAKYDVDVALIKTVKAVESAADAFIDGRPTILFEPHRFSRATGGHFDKTNPRVSYRTWDRTKYPRSQEARWDQLLEAVSLDVDAGFASASYGGFQILGENHFVCGYASSFEFVYSQTRDEYEQLKAFGEFVFNRKLLPALRRKDWDAFALGYNGTGYKLNDYAGKLARTYAKIAKV